MGSQTSRSFATVLSIRKHDPKVKGPLSSHKTRIILKGAIGAAVGRSKLILTKQNRKKKRNIERYQVQGGAQSGQLREGSRGKQPHGWRVIVKAEREKESKRGDRWVVFLGNSRARSAARYRAACGRVTLAQCQFLHTHRTVVYAYTRRAAGSHPRTATQTQLSDNTVHDDHGTRGWLGCAG